MSRNTTYDRSATYSPQAVYRHVYFMYVPDIEYNGKERGKTYKAARKTVSRGNVHL